VGFGDRKVCGQLRGFAAVARRSAVLTAQAPHAELGSKQKPCRTSAARSHGSTTVYRHRLSRASGRVDADLADPSSGWSMNGAVGLIGV
jgi:hypothetical protein